MSVQISENDILRIFARLKRRGVKYTDVQHELVDHIATDIERITAEQPKLNMEQKLDIAFAQFPYDMGKIVRAKEKQMNKYWRRKTLQFIKTYFTLPKLFMTLSLFIGIYLGTWFGGKITLLTAILLLIPVIIYTTYFYYFNLGMSSKKEKEYLVYRMFMSNSITMVMIPAGFINIVSQGHKYGESFYDWRLAVLAFLIVTTYIWAHACLTEFPNMLKEELDKKYPYLQLSN